MKKVTEISQEARSETLVSDHGNKPQQNSLTLVYPKITSNSFASVGEPGSPTPSFTSTLNDLRQWTASPMTETRANDHSIAQLSPKKRSIMVVADPSLTTCFDRLADAELYSLWVG